MTFLAAARKKRDLSASFYFVIRFVWSTFSYSSGLPGGIFLPVLTLGAILGFGFGLVGQGLGLYADNYLVLFLVM